MVRVEIDSDAIFQQVMAHPKVQAKVQERGAKTASKLRAELQRSGVDAAVQVRKHNTATGRASLNVAMTGVKDFERRKAARIARRVRRSIR